MVHQTPDIIPGGVPEGINHWRILEFQDKFLKKIQKEFQEGLLET